MLKTARIPQLKSLTQGCSQWFPNLMKLSQPWLSIGCGLALTLSIPSISLAQSVGTLPPPPPLRVPKNAVPPTTIEPATPIETKSTEVVPVQSDETKSTEVIPVQTVPDSKSSSAIREYTFQAPTTPDSPNSTIPATSIPDTSETSLPISQPTYKTTDKTPSLYRVEVPNSQVSVLAQVQAVEPLAFIRQSEGVIHAGMFQQSQQAQQRVQELERQGVSAQVVPVYENQGRSASGSSRRVVRE